MTTIERYKKMYSDPNDSDNISIQNNKATIPTWLCIYLIHSSGIKSKKKRIVKKTLKKQMHKLLKQYLENAKNSQT